MEAVWSGASERTRALFVSHVTSPTALVFPVGELCRRAREAGVVAVVDGAHGPGHVPLDLAALDADAYAGNCHKWLCTPKGGGFLWVRPGLQDTVDSLVLGWGLAEQDASFVVRSEEQEHVIPLRTWPYRPLSTSSRSEPGRMFAAVATIWPPLQPDSSEWFGQMVTAALPDCDAAAVCQALAREHRVEVYGKAWNGRPVIRVSAQGYTSADELERLLNALPNVLARYVSRS